MKRLVFLVAIVIIFGCNREKSRFQNIEKENLNQEQIDSILDDYNFDYSNVVFIDSLEKAIIPITSKNLRGKRNSYRSSYDVSDSFSYWNFIFYDIGTGEIKLLTEKKTGITDFRTNLDNVGPVLSNSVLYTAGDTDYNQDLRLTYEDPSYLFISDTDGRDFRRLSPVAEHVREFRIIPDSDKIIFQTYRDTNQDLIFNSKDDKIWYLIDIGVNSEAIEIISPDKRNEIKSLYFNQWLVKTKKTE
jgi:hypothetical protein